MTTDEIKTTAARTVLLLRGAYPTAPAGDSSEVLVLPGADPGALGELRLGPETLVLAPQGSAHDIGGAQVAAYTGDLTEGEQEIVFEGGFVVRRESYTAAPFMPVTCLTAVGILGPDDHDNFLADADAAAQDGSFEEHLLHPLVILADACALGACDCAAPRRARAVVGADGARPALGGALTRWAPSGPAVRDACVLGRSCTRRRQEVLPLWISALFDHRRTSGAGGQDRAGVDGRAKRLSETAMPARTIMVPTKRFMETPRRSPSACSAR